MLNDDVGGYACGYGNNSNSNSNKNKITIVIVIMLLLPLNPCQQSMNGANRERALHSIGAILDELILPLNERISALEAENQM